MKRLPRLFGLHDWETNYSGKFYPFWRRCRRCGYRYRKGRLIIGD